MSKKETEPHMQQQKSNNEALTKGSRTEAAIKDAARRVLARDGYVNAKIGDIAEEAGKAVGSFYQYFRNKEVLLLALAEEFRLALQSGIQPPKDPTENPFDNLRRTIRSFWAVYRAHGAVAVAVFQASMVDESFAAIWQQIRQEGIRVSGTRIRLAQRLGYCPGLDPEIAASVLCSMIEFTCYNWTVQNGDLVRIQRGDVADDLLVTTLTELVVRTINWRDPLADKGQ
jgi:AcrR family transcriptional regulator